MFIQFDPTSPEGLAEQIAGQVRGALLEGRLAPGDKLPAARELAAGLDVNMHTVLRAYATLRDEGLIELRRGRGAQVRSDVTIEGAELDQKLKDLVVAASRLGISRAQLVRRLQEVSP